MATVMEAEGMAELGMWQEAWDALESLPVAERATPPALRVRLDLCPYLEAWAHGEAIANLLRDGGDEDRRAAGVFYRELAKLYILHNEMESARNAVRDCAATWPPGREELLDDPAIAGLM